MVDEATETKTNTEVGGLVEPLVMPNGTRIKPQDIRIRKWHEDNQRYEECSLRELWENGFHCGQSFQAHNKHLRDKKYMNANGFHVEPEFFDEVWTAFWRDLNDAELVFR